MKNNLKKIFLFISIIGSQFSYSQILNHDNYSKIQDTFVDYAISKGDDLVKINVKDYDNKTKDEIEYLNSLKGINDIQDYMVNNILEGKITNSFAAINFPNADKNFWVYPQGFLPDDLDKNYCSMLFPFGEISKCLQTPDFVKLNLKKILENNGIVFDYEYLNNFYFIHELVHLIPSQRKTPDNVDVFKVWIDDLNMHYREVYSDLFAIIFLSNYLGYNQDKIINITRLRDFNLNSNDDLIHFSSPYIRTLINDNKWKELKSFEDIDLYIKKIFKETIDQTTISKKNYRYVHEKNFDWCNHLDFMGATSQDVIGILVKHCKKLKEY